MAEQAPGQDDALDLRGLKCPQPVLRLRRALLRLAPGRSVTVLCTDPMAAIDIPNLLRETGDVLLEANSAGGILTFRVRRRPAAETGG